MLPSKIRSSRGLSRCLYSPHHVHPVSQKGILWFPCISPARRSGQGLGASVFGSFVPRSAGIRFCSARYLDWWQSPTASSASLHGRTFPPCPRESRRRCFPGYPNSLWLLLCQPFVRGVCTLPSTKTFAAGGLSTGKMASSVPPPPLGSRPLTLDELSAYTFGNFACVVDPAVVPKLSREFGRRFPQGGNTECFSSLNLPALPEGAPVLHSTAVRATAVLRIVSLLNNAGGVRTGILTSLCSLLNEASPPVTKLPRHPLPLASSVPLAPFSTYPSALQYMLNGAVEHLAKADPSAPQAISIDEAAAFCGGCSEVAGRLFVASRLLSVLVTLQDCNAALLTEALLVPTDFFSHQQRRLPPIKGIEKSATNIGNLLHDSKLPASSRKSVAEVNATCPSLALLLPALGNLREALQSLSVYLNAELKNVAERPGSVTPLPSESLESMCPDAGLSRMIDERTADICSSPSPASPAALFRPSAMSVKMALDSLLPCLAGILQTLLAASAELAPDSLKGGEWPALEEEGEEGQANAFKPPEKPDCNVYLGVGTAGGRCMRVTDVTQRVARFSDGLAASREQASADPGTELVFQIEERLVALQEISALQTALLLQIIEFADVRAFLDAVAKAERQPKGKKKIGSRYGMSHGTRRYQQYLTALVRETLSKGGLTSGTCGQPQCAVHSEHGPSDGDVCLAALRALLLAGGPEEAGAAAALSAGAPASVPAFCDQEGHLEVLLTPINQVRRVPKAAKGTQDFGPAQMAVRELVLGSVREVFRRHGGVEIDTPVFELRETLLGKYGENQKLVYDLKDQGGEQLSLRYDLTVPFARYVASHDIEKIRRFHIGKVYRRDEPQMNRGRFREFYQCDFDIAGVSPVKMVPDAEAVCIMVEALRTLQGMVGKFHVKTNHRVLLDGMMEVCGLPADKFTTACSSIDKLDKEPWAAVRRELVDTKGVAADVADRLGELVQMRGTFSQIIADLSKKPDFASNEKVALALQEMEIFSQYIEAMGVQTDEAIFDLSLARGLDYYSGVIFEAVLVGTDGAAVGSVGGGGRYDKLVGMFSGRDVPAVGMSVGVERLFRMVEKSLGMAAAPTAEEDEHAGDKKKKKKEKATQEVPSLVRESFTDVLVCSVGDNMLKACMSVAGSLWRNGIAAEFFYGAGAKLKKQMDMACQRRIPLLVILGEEELKRNTAKVRQLWYDDDVKRPDTNGEGSAGEKEEEVSLDQLPQVIKAYFCQHGTTLERMKRRVFDTAAVVNADGA
ncbi:histidyl-tRNA synthetase (HisRS), putative [Toxoplasma gondii ME49]|uniref:Histidine--tRNA ligase, cytoplasmic n=6 Tax=Toxoplasma gondii TaxID=5811 RepID=S7W2N3_TOXGG|nr:histidyl-tRNA synthetase (HisRS), putative [Toxoplasma gondii ME49]EPR61304.1 putative histidyl-tRNA synthetase (HisRS) [Toxoplasma gondii GT1]KAF4642554.1 putative histidyl-tRNA synthetase (HisRS) [Toxoplasma gondii]KFG36325.1 putative histidyl-tRNA synthetase (HisRS) [Toxoplasma gondii FOU]PIM02231.1 putative histidyl-tRNA synthetase (HisRS) [Toxoplasma gondii COUG]EPT29842.1 histidyl-tRNA synthetase (HisRS), putative [Toxoplasma gondii ME49]|eukprot:XP_002371454.2 histidyl-tRNA synthetase (HisRS), putative [Toxoplasma gondii ME49]